MKDLSTYLRDHLAGSVGALEMLDGMIGADHDQAIKTFLVSLREEICSDQRELKDLMEHLEITESATRNAGAWITEKISRAKLGGGDSGEPGLELLQSLEALSLGITGKRSLWRNLAAAAKTAPQLRKLDFARLEARAAEQFERVESTAREIARRVFATELNNSAAA